MGWGPLESWIEKHRAAISRDPALAATKIEADLARASRPRDQVRLLGLLTAAHRHRRDWRASEAAIQRASRIRRPGAIARAELEGQIAALRLDQAMAGDDWGRARRAADRYLVSIPPERDPEPKTKWAVRQARTRAALRSAAYVIRGQVQLYGYSDVPAAYQDGIRGLAAAPRYQREKRVHRSHLAAASLLANAATHGGTTPEDLQDAARLVAEILRRLSPHDVIPRAQLRLALAGILARSGEPGKAEDLLLRSLDELREVGARNTYAQTVTCLEWIVRDCQRKPGRASYLRLRLEGQCGDVVDRNA